MVTEYWKPVMFKDKDGNLVYEMLAISKELYDDAKMAKQYEPAFQYVIDKRQKEILDGDK